MTGQEMKAPEKGVGVRLYNTGFGDCILLAFKDIDEEPRYMLIDCGVHHIYPDNKEQIRKVAQSISDATSNKIHVVAVTHEHTDHLYGFKYARDIFDKIEIDELWLPWTEDPDSSAAEELKKLYKKRNFAINQAVNILNISYPDYAERLKMLPSYEEPINFELHGGKADQVPYLKSRSRKKLVNSNDYLVPGDTKYLEGVDDVKFYILGPPKDVKWIRSLERKKELYPEEEELDEETSMEAALLASGTGNFEDDLFQKSIPFKEKYRVKEDEAKKDVFFIKHYGFSEEEDHGPSWRRIDDDWLWTAEHLALDLDTKTNNTSLVLAIELRHQEPYKVLLFAADAQVGNWLSWYNLSWGEGEDKIIKIEDLLERTVLYKVGHHGSHNATLKRKGLEKMTNKELVSMIPVDEKWAHTGPGWEHPAKKLLANLKKKSRSRVIRTDQIPCTEKYHDKPSEVTEEEWDKFQDNLTWDKDERLWIEYTIE